MSILMNAECFELVRPVDIVGKSGTGRVGYGLQLTNQQCLLVWRNSGSDTITVYRNVEKLKDIHCHNGTTLNWIPSIVDAEAVILKDAIDQLMLAYNSASTYLFR